MKRYNDESDGRDDGSKISDVEATRFRAMEARCNFVGSDRLDLQFVAKEVLRCVGCREIVVQIAKYLTGEYHRIVQMSPSGGDDGVTHAFRDSDWAGCLETRKSTSGGALFVGQCTTAHWPVTRKAMALSSAEAEVYASTRATCEAEGLKSLDQDVGEDLRIVAWVDGQATIGLSFSSGLGKARHKETAEF